MGKLGDVVALSDEEPPGRSEHASPSRLEAVVALSDEEPCSTLPRVRQKERLVSYTEKHGVKVLVQRLVTQKCKCSRGRCLQRLSGQVAEICDMRVRKLQMDKRDADSLATPSDSRRLVLAWPFMPQDLLTGSFIAPEP